MMNERIKELEQQAMTFRAGIQMLDTDKFAELIVRECADVIQKEVSMKYKDGGETEEFMGGHYAGSVLARVMIRKHFGVEE
jgi:uncharacterized membrane protein